MLITDQNALDNFLDGLKTVPYVTVDTEFLREKTYYSKLCLIQISDPDKNAAAIDVIANPDLDLTPLFEIFKNPNICKVFHAGRQDLEIFWQDFNLLPAPLFDTQIAAMVLGHGEQAGFHTLVQNVSGQNVDKSQQFTDWSRRPLTDKQLKYALDDVLLLVDLYESLKQELEARGRTGWVLEETENLLDPDLYETKPEEAFQRIRVKAPTSKQLAILRELAAWRERKAKEQNIPKTRILKDDALVELSFHPPKDAGDLKKMRGFPSGSAEKPLGNAVLDAVAKGLAVPKKEQPQPVKKQILDKAYRPALEMLKMLARIKAAEHDVTPRLLASSDELEILAIKQDHADIPALKGWRRNIFGEDALAVLSGEKAIALKSGKIITI